MPNYKNIRLFFCSCLFALLLSGNLFSQNAEEETGSAHADFIAKLSPEEALPELNDAIRKGELKRCSLVLGQFPALIDKKDKFACTPLSNAAYAGNAEIVKFLLEKKANISIANNYGDQPVHRAAQAGHMEVLELLFANGAVFWAKNRKGETPLFKAAGEGKKEAVEYLISKGDFINTVDNQDNTPLHKAALKGNPAFIKFMLSIGAKANAKNKAGKKPSDLTQNSEVKAILDANDPEIKK